MNDVIIYQFKAKSWFSKMIAWYTRGSYSHTGFSLKGVYYESTNKNGVWKRHEKTKGLSEYLGRADKFLLVGLPLFSGEENIAHPLAESLNRMQVFAESQVGKKYDHKMVSAFISRKTQESRKSSNKWFCSELMFATLAKGGFKLFNCEPWQVSPNLVAFSTLLKRIN